MSANPVPLLTPEELHQSWQSRTADGVAEQIEAELRKVIAGEVRFDAGSKALYATDGSNYRQVPIGVVIPKSREDVIETLAVCRKYGAPALSRGGGTSLAGQCCNVAIVIDWSKYLHNIVELNPEEKYARVQPGTICDALRNAAKPYTLTWGPDPATHDHCTFGGMLGNNSCGVHAQMAGKSAENVLSMDILLYDGTQMTVGWMDDQAYLRRSLKILAPYLADGTPVVVLEPSCCSVFRDELHNLFPDSEEARLMEENTFTLSEFLAQKIAGYEPPRLNRRAIVQGHCHHKAIMRFKEERSIMEEMNLDYEVLESGCCGMAGSFGYETDKYDVSIACGERVLLPAVRQARLSTLIIADGFSCKEQIAQQTNRHALHLAEVLEMGIKPPGQLMYPEKQFVEPRKKAQSRSMLRAGIISGCLLGLAVGILGMRRCRAK